MAWFNKRMAKKIRGKGGKERLAPLNDAARAAVRAWLRKEVADEVAEATRIVYTGSVGAANAKDYAACADVDGFVCGRSSLVAAEFVTVCRAHLA